MDEPCSALDPIATLAIEELMHELKSTYTIVIVTHNMQQAARVLDTHGVLHDRRHRRMPGYVVEMDDTDEDVLEPETAVDDRLRDRAVRLMNELRSEFHSATRRDPDRHRPDVGRRHRTRSRGRPRSC